MQAYKYTTYNKEQSDSLPENISKKSLVSMVRVASAAVGGFPWPAEPLPVLRSMYQSPDSEPESEFDSQVRGYFITYGHLTSVKY
jgi:hypothetical protein